MVWSFEDLVSSIVEKIRNCNTEILVATRLAPEAAINEIIHKSKAGVKVKVLADTKLVKGYFKSQTTSLGFDSNINSSDNDNHKTDKKNENERVQVVGHGILTMKASSEGYAIFHLA